MFGIRLLKTYIQNIDSKYGTFSEIDLKSDKMEEVYQNLTFLLNYVNSTQLK